METIKEIRVREQDGTVSNPYPIGADAKNIDTADGSNVEAKLANTGTKEDLKVLENQIKSVASGSPKGHYETATALKSANPETGVYIVTANGHIYSWTKDQTGDPIDLGVYQATGIADESVKRSSTTFFEKTENVFDYENADIVKAAIYADGGFNNSATSKSLIVPIEANTNYVVKMEKVGKRLVIADSTNYPSIGSTVNILSGNVNVDNTDIVKKITTSSSANYLIVFFSNTTSESTNNGYTEEEILKSITIKKDIDTSNGVPALVLDQNNIKDNSISARKIDKNLSSQLYNYEKSPQYYGFNNSILFKCFTGGISGTDGSLSFNKKRVITDFITPAKNKIVIVNKSNGVYKCRIAQYDSTGTFLSVSSYSSDEKTVINLNSNTAKILMNVMYVTNTDRYMSDVLEDIENNIMICEGEYKNPSVSKFYGKKILFDGDSITYGITSGSNRAENPYPKLVGEKLNCEVTNIAVAGARYTKRSSSTIDLSTRAETFDYSGYDYYMLSAGTNDWTDGIEFGSLDSTDKTTLYGALNYIIGRIYEDNPNAVIGVMTPIARFRRLDTYANCLHDIEINNHTLLDITNAIIEYCNYYSIPVANMSFNSPLNEWNKDNTAITTDKLHLQQEGYNIMANKVAGWLEANL